MNRRERQKRLKANLDEAYHETWNTFVNYLKGPYPELLKSKNQKKVFNIYQKQVAEKFEPVLYIMANNFYNKKVKWIPSPSRV